MAENLKVTKYRNGNNITHITDTDSWENNTNGAYGYYDNNTSNLDTYGMLYNWYAVDNSTSRYICPHGWHVPTDSEFSDLANELGNNPAAKLKEAGTVHWSSQSAGTNNSSGFTALPAGFRSTNGTYSQLSTHTYFWTSNYSSSTNATFRYLNSSSSSIFNSFSNSKKFGFSVRCLKDD